MSMQVVQGRLKQSRMIRKGEGKGGKGRTYDGYNGYICYAMANVRGVDHVIFVSYFLIVKVSLYSLVFKVFLERDLMLITAQIVKRIGNKKLSC